MISSGRDATNASSDPASGPRTRRLALIIALAVVVVAGLVVALTRISSGTDERSRLAARLLTVAELPLGWRDAPTTSPTTSIADNPCLAGLSDRSDPAAQATSTFVEGEGLPYLAETLVGATSPAHRFATATATLARCRTLSFTEGTSTVRGTLRPLALAPVGSVSTAYSLAFFTSGLHITTDLVLFTTHSYLGLVVLGDSAPPPSSTVQAFADAALARAGGATPRVAPVSIVSVPVRVAHTSDGDVGYRAFGHGPPLVLITGYTGTMEDWDPRFVDALAQHHRVVVFDNAGIGATSATPGPLSIDAMADQTSALISALHLGRPDVLGWSMGTMIAQALAVSHPSQVDRLVLCAAYPGNGQVVRPPQKDINALTNGDTKLAEADLFPAGQSGAESAFAAALNDWPAATGASPAVAAAQRAAVRRWWDGTDPAAARVDAIGAPTLVADGALDRLDPSANDRAVARLIPGARLDLYPGAGHAFLFQDEATFVPVVEEFLG